MVNNKTLLYEILPDLNLIIDSWFGDLTFEKVLNAKLEQIKDTRWNQSYHNISDIRNAEFVLDNAEARKIIEYTKSDTRWQYERKTAYITDNPNQVVFQKLLEINKSQEIPNQMESFSTLKGALDYLLIESSEMDRIGDIIRKLSI